MINYNVYGNPETWIDRKLMGANTTYIVKVGNFVETSTYGQNGWFAYQTAEQGRRDIHIDESFCYIRMDKNAPMLYAKTSSAPHVTNNYQSCNRWDLYPGKNTPFGWACINSNNITGDNYRLYNTYTSVQNYIWNPKGSFFPAAVPTYYTYNGIDVPAYNGLCREPVLSFPYKQLVLVPVVNAYKFATGKTAEDLQQAITRTDYYACLGANVHCDLRTYLTAAIALNDPTLYCEEYPIVTDIQAVPCWITFDPDTHIATNIYPVMNSAPQSNYSMLVECFLQQTPVKPDVYYYGSAVNRAENEDVYITPGILSHMYRSGSYTVRKSTSLTVTVYDCVLMQGTDWNNAGNTNQYTWLSSRCDPNGIFTLVEFTDSQLSGVYHIIDNTDTSVFHDYVRRCIAYFGMFWVEGFDLTGHTIPDTLDTDECFLGIIDNNDVTHGEWLQGADIPESPQYGWDNPIDDNPYNPGETPDTEIPSDNLLLNTYAENGFSVGSNFYALRRTDLDDLTNWINWYMNYEKAESAAVAAGNPYEQYFADKFKTPADWYAYVYAMAGNGVHPNNNILSLMVFPFELSGTDDGYKLGSWETDVYHNYFQLIPDTPILTGKKITGDGYKILNFGNGVVTFPGVAGDFRDVMPYTRLELQIPYHGTITLDPGDWINHTISITVICDIMTGASMAVICRDSAPMLTAAGQLGISVPLSVDNFSQTSNTLTALSSTVQSGLVNSVNDVSQGAAGAVSGIFGSVAAGISGNLPGVVSGATSTLSGEWNTIAKTVNNVIGMKQNIYDMQHTVNGKMIIGTAAPSVNSKYETKCRLVWHYPKIVKNSNAEEYKKLSGCSCNITGIVGDFSGGFAQFGAVDLTGISATDEEKAIILTALQNGVFI